MKKYMFILKKSNLKFEIGKRYFLKDYSLWFYNSIENMSHLFLQSKYYKIYEIKLFTNKNVFAEDFKISELHTMLKHRCFLLQPS